MRRLLFSIAILFAIVIGFYQYNRLYDVYTVPHLVVTETIVEQAPPQLMERRSEPMVVPDSLMSDSIRYTIIPEESIEDSVVVSQRVERVVSEQGRYMPSDTALQVEFWVDIITSLASAIAPILIPFIIYRRKKEE